MKVAFPSLVHVGFLYSNHTFLIHLTLPKSLVFLSLALPILKPYFSASLVSSPWYDLSQTLFFALMTAFLASFLALIHLALLPLSSDVQLTKVVYASCLSLAFSFTSSFHHQAPSVLLLSNLKTPKMPQAELPRQGLLPLFPHYIRIHS